MCVRVCVSLTWGLPSWLNPTTVRSTCGLSVEGFGVGIYGSGGRFWLAELACVGGVIFQNHLMNTLCQMNALDGSKGIGWAGATSAFLLLVATNAWTTDTTPAPAS